jgi:hypothetical protein
MALSSSIPNEESTLRLIGAVLFEQNDDWQSQHRYMMVEAFGISAPKPRRTSLQGLAGLG